MPPGSNPARASGHGQIQPTLNRGHGGPPSGKRAHVGQGKRATANKGIPKTSQEESFQLLSRPDSPQQRPFAMTIRLQPEILEKLKQAELEGIRSFMKFGTNASGHAIQVGDDTFKFSSAREPGDLCDIYEQEKGEVEDTVLVEAGSVWRKLSVPRILSAKEKDRVKQRTAEAEKKQRQRKSILVDPSTQKVILGRMGQEANGKRSMSKLIKEPPPKKLKITTGLNGNSSAPRSMGCANVTAVTGNYQVAGSTSQPLTERTSGPFSSQGISIQKDKRQTPNTTAPFVKRKAESTASVTDVRNFLIRLLQENMRGVTMKTIEKAMTERLLVTPDKKVLEKVLRSVALYQAPGKYILRSELEKASSMDVVGPDESARALEHSRALEPSRAMTPSKATEPSRDVVGTLNVTKHSIMESSLSKHTGAHVLKGPSMVASNLSSSSGNGSDRGSDIDSNYGGFCTSTDEYVNIMSDDETEKKLELKGKPRVRTSKLGTEEEDSRRSRAILGKQRNDSDTHLLQQVSSLARGWTSNGCAPAKNSEDLGGGHDTDPEHLGGGRVHKVGIIEKVGLGLVQAERSLKGVDATRRGNDVCERGMLKEAGPAERPPPRENGSSDSRRDVLKAEDILDTTKRQGLTSTNLLGSQFLAPYAKHMPDLCGPVNVHEEYKVYCKEYHEKYPFYIKLHSTIVQEKELFRKLRKDLERTMLKDDDNKLVQKMKKELSVHCKKCKRLLGAFRKLHEELATIKRRCCEYAQKMGDG